jgi:hypothetical protein
MKNLKSLFSIILIAFTLITVTSCGDESEDPKPSNPTITIDKLIGTYKTTSVLYNGKTFTDACDLNWSVNTTSLRKIDLKFEGGSNNFTDLTNYRCVSGSTETNILEDNIASLTGTTLDLDGSYKFNVISLTNGLLKLELLSTTAVTTPIGAVYTMQKQ